jgi:mediator of RNA polymerase II transcription subunit 14
MRDTGDLASAGRGPRFAAVTNHVNENPPMLVGALARMRVNVRAHDACLKFEVDWFS